MEEIRQGYEAECMKKFQWIKDFNLQEYKDKNAPLVMFGCYKPKDKQTALNHKGQVLIIWMGSDTWKINAKELVRENITHATWIPNIKNHLKEKGIDCKLLKVPLKEKKPNPVKLGNEVYTYIQWNKPDFYGSEVIDSLKINHKLLIGKHHIDQGEWYNGVRNKFYSRAFIGLVLSSYAGGAMTVQELGLRGIKAVTNVLGLPNCVSWKSKSDVEKLVKNESENIGKVNQCLADQVYESLIKINKKIDDSIFDDQKRVGSS